ncbi:hypothetical protein E0Z10_g8310 [Xylaria hypoxylon]|uniref:J domain-containing protein n=1 Tax=Xylaria hypoxylon TaxID=37992 RepID=A0A4Z0Y9H7_9PEZI|nr:hypothetical protein E0Z10_g8310 [Xylaria hypoxylon]
MTVLPPDPYKVLGVSKDAQIPEIRSAHRKLVLRCHPDKIQDPALKEAKQIEFQQVQQAYELLSNEIEREKYDRKAEAFEHLREREREKARTSATRATSSTPKQSPVFYHVKEASPRATTFAKSSPYARTPPRSWEDTTSAARMFEEATRYARKTASYEKEKPSKRDEERRKREEDKEWAREKEKAKERELREARKARDRKEEKDRSARDREEREKEKRKDEKKKAHSDREREREKERKSAAAEKHRSRQHPIIEESSDSSDSSDEDVIFEAPPPKSDRKKSSSGHKPEDMEALSTSERTRKLSGNMETAIRYLTRSGGKAPAAFIRSQTYTEGTSKLYATPMVPTPPPAAGAPFAPPPPPPPVAEPEEISEDDMARRSSARPSLRRMSQDTPRSSREKSSLHKKSSSSRDHQPIIVEAGSPPVRPVPSLSRAHTDSYARPIPVPGMSRADTWYPSTERERERHEGSRRDLHRWCTQTLRTLRVIETVVTDEVDELNLLSPCQHTFDTVWIAMARRAYRYARNNTMINRRVVRTNQREAMLCQTLRRVCTERIHHTTTMRNGLLNSSPESNIQRNSTSEIFATATFPTDHRTDQMFTLRGNTLDTSYLFHLIPGVFGLIYALVQEDLNLAFWAS